jgi:hypothetical protein
MTNREETGDETSSQASAEASRDRTTPPDAAPPDSASPEATATSQDTASSEAAASPEAAATPAAAAVGEGSEVTASSVQAANGRADGAERAASEDAGPGTQPRFPWKAIVSLVAAVVVAVGVLAVYHVVRSGNGGPLSIANVDSTGTVPRESPVVVAIPITAKRSADVVIDSVSLRGGDDRRAPILKAVLADHDESCSGIWWPLGGIGSFARRCAPDGTATLIGRSIPAGGPTWVSAAASRSVRSTDLAIEVFAPGPGHCWNVGSVKIQYHVGSHHYTTVGGESIAACAGLTAETAHGPIAVDG